MTDQKTALLNKISARSATIAIYGLGYVGLPLALRFSEAGFRVIGFDTDESKVNGINTGRSHIERISNEEIARANSRGFSATSNFDRTSDADALIICVPTPLGRHNEPDLSFITGTMTRIRPHLKAGQIVSLESTTYPGTTEEELLPVIDKLGLKAGEDIFLVYSPEREDPGNESFVTRTIPKICGGYSSNCLEVGQTLYESAVDKIVPVSSLKTAEMTKLLENIYRAVNIGLVNELKIVADRMDIDIHEVIDAAATKPFGFTPFYPGPGLGGHCIPIDPFYLTWKAREYGVRTQFIELAGVINSSMPEWVVLKISEALNTAGKALSQSRILVLGVAYKSNIDDLRESPALPIIALLRENGAEVAYSDPHVPVLLGSRRYQIDLESRPLTIAEIKSYDALVLVTNHDDYDLDLIARHAAVIVDTRGAYWKKNLENVCPA